MSTPTLSPCTSCSKCTHSTSQTSVFTRTVPQNIICKMQGLLLVNVNCGSAFISFLLSVQSVEGGYSFARQHSRGWLWKWWWWWEWGDDKRDESHEDHRSLMTASSSSLENIWNSLSGVTVAIWRQEPQGIVSVSQQLGQNCSLGAILGNHYANYEIFLPKPLHILIYIKLILIEEPVLKWSAFTKTDTNRIWFTREWMMCTVEESHKFWGTA